jgi:O-antigen/teichoic acid export membrane protein
LTAAVMYFSRSFVWASIASAGIMMMFGAVAFAMVYRPAQLGDEAGARLQYAPSLIAVTALGFGVSGLERFALERMASASAVAVYAAGYALARQGFDVVGNTANLGGFSRLMGAYQTGRTAETRAVAGEQLLLLLAIFLPACYLLTLISRDIANMFLPPSYVTEAAKIMPVVALGAIAMNLRSFLFDNILHAAGKSKLQLFPLMAGALVTAAISSVMVPAGGGVGAAGAFAAGAAVACAAGCILSLRFVRPLVQKKAVLRTLAGIAACCVLSYVASALFSGASAVVRVIAVSAVAAGVGVIGLLQINTRRHSR